MAEDGNLEESAKCGSEGGGKFEHKIAEGCESEDVK